MQEYRQQGIKRNRMTQLAGVGKSVAQKAADLSEKVKEVMADLMAKGIVAVHTAKEKLRPFYRTLKMRLGSAWQNILDYRAPADKEKDADCERYEHVAAQSVLLILEGPDPIETFCNLDQEAQKYVLSEIHQAYCRGVGIETPELVFTDALAPMTDGSYIYKYHVVLIDSALLAQPMEYAKAQQLIGVLIHEDFHAFQDCAVLDPERYHVPRNVAKMWRDNEKNYITFAQNPIAYRLQPMEAYAYRVAGNAMALLRNEEYVRMVEDALNQREESEL